MWATLIGCPDSEVTSRASAAKTLISFSQNMSNSPKEVLKACKLHLGDDGPNLSMLRPWHRDALCIIYPWWRVDSSHNRPLMWIFDVFLIISTLTVDLKVELQAIVYALNLKRRQSNGMVWNGVWLWNNSTTLIFYAFCETLIKCLNVTPSMQSFH